DGRGAAVREVLARRDRIERDAIAIRDPNHLPHLLDIVRRDRGRYDALVAFAAHGRVRVPIYGHTRGGREYPFGAQRRRKRLQRRREILLAYTRGTHYYEHL